MRSDGSDLTSRAIYATMQAGASAYYPDSIAGVRRGAEMSFDEADHNSVNPKLISSKAYRENCQSCVVAFEARRRGYDVSAAPYDRHSATHALSIKTNMAWIVPGTNEHPEYITDSSVNTSDQLLEFLEKTIEPGQRYAFQFLRKSGGGHIICADRDDMGNLRLYDPQRWKSRKGKSISRYLNGVVVNSKVPENRPTLLRIDNMEFNTGITDEIMRAKG